MEYSQEMYAACERTVETAFVDATNCILQLGQTSLCDEGIVKHKRAQCAAARHGVFVDHKFRSLHAMDLATLYFPALASDIWGGGFAFNTTPGLSSTKKRESLLERARDCGTGRWALLVCARVVCGHAPTLARLREHATVAATATMTYDDPAAYAWPWAEGLAVEERAQVVLAASKIIDDVRAGREPNFAHARKVVRVVDVLGEIAYIAGCPLPAAAAADAAPTLKFGKNRRRVIGTVLGAALWSDETRAAVLHMLCDLAAACRPTAS